ncbi:MAG: hypothetical protein Q8P32_04940 [Candidatus Komeilibacteria bacterium]|nr:hypothetical protein [Candidatus Komeilibacteria bacterium]
MKKILIISLVLFLTGCTVERPRPPLDLSKINWELEAFLAQQEAAVVYQAAATASQNFVDGPCLSESLFGNSEYPETLWVLDIAHNPRTEVDNQPANQCSASRDGKAQNYIELDEQGQIIKVYSPFLQEAD